MSQLSLFERKEQELVPGAIHIPSWLTLKEQQQLLALCRESAKPPAGLYTQKMLDGTSLSVRVVCLGWHWYPYRYSKTRDDCDRLACKPFPSELRQLAQKALSVTLPQYQNFQPDVAIINWYGDAAKLGMHQDKSESEIVRNAGSPIVSISLGDSCKFRFGNTASRSGEHQDIELHSGDLFVFGAAARMAFHAVLKTYPGTAPPQLGIKQGRVNITIRETGLKHSQ